MKKIRLFVFDFDGTLVDTKRDIAESVNLTLAQLDVRTLPDETIYSYIGRGVGPLLARALEKTGVDNIPSAVEIFIKYYDERLLDHSVFYPNCRETLSFFSGKTLTICSNKPRRFITKILKGLGSLEQFTTIVGGDGPAQKKPHPQGLLDILSAHAVSPDEAVMVGDSPIDVETGRKAKVKTCAVTYGLSERKCLEDAQPDWTVDDFADLRRIFT